MTFCPQIDLSDTSQTSHRWTDGWRPSETGPHNLLSFLTANSTPNYFLMSHMLIFCDIRNKSAVFNILQQNETIFDIENG